MNIILQNDEIIDSIKETKNISFETLKTIINNILINNNLLPLVSEIKNSKLNTAYGSMQLKTYIVSKTNCIIEIDYDKIQTDYKNNYQELIYNLIYVVLHEIEHVNQVKIMMDKNNYQNETLKKLAVLYKRSFYLEELFGHEKINDYDNLIIEYNAKLLGNINTIRFIETYLSNIFTENFIENKNIEITNYINQKSNIKESFNKLFKKYEQEYIESDYYKRVTNKMLIERHYSKTNFITDEFINEQFILLLIGETNIYNKIISKNKNIPFHKLNEIIIRSINEKRIKRKN